MAKMYRYAERHQAFAGKAIGIFPPIIRFPEKVSLCGEASSACRRSYRYFPAHHAFPGKTNVFRRGVLHLSNNLSLFLCPLNVSRKKCRFPGRHHAFVEKVVVMLLSITSFPEEVSICPPPHGSESLGGPRRGLFQSTFFKITPRGQGTRCQSVLPATSSVFTLLWGEDDIRSATVRK